MNRNTAATALVILAIALILSCGQKQESTQPKGPAAMLVAKVDSLGLERSSEVRVFVGDSLWEYINGGAELYHTYEFVDVATAYYLQDSTEIVVDIYRFATPDDAYGMYTQLRPGGPGELDYGVEGFGSVSNIVFVKDQFIGMFTGYEATEKVSRAVNTAAAYFARILPGRESRPETYSVFPRGDAVEGSDNKQSESYLGYVFMEDVYSQKYLFGDDTVTLFFTDDPAGAKFLSWKNQLGQEGLSDESLAGLRFDDNMALRYEHSFYGNVVAGLTAGKLVGAIGYRDDHADFMAEWIMALKNPLK